MNILSTPCRKSSRSGPIPTPSVLQPDYELTYARLASYRFDINTEVLPALEIASSKASLRGALATSQSPDTN